MDTRGIKLDVARTFGEVVTIIVGVLIALAVDQWNDNRLERVEEETAIDGIVSELKEDLSMFEVRLGALKAKTASLVRVQNAFNQSSVSGAGAEAFLNDVVVGANFGWNQGSASRATYDDLISSGKLAIIERSDVRLAIADYYDYYNDEHDRINERETLYPNLSYRLVPRKVVITDSGYVYESGLQPGLSEEELRDLVSQVLGSSLKDQLIAEINLAQFISSITKTTQLRAQALVDVLEKYRESS